MPPPPPPAATAMSAAAAKPPAIQPQVPLDMPEEVFSPAASPAVDGPVTTPEVSGLLGQVPPRRIWAPA